MSTSAQNTQNDNPTHPWWAAVLLFLPALAFSLIYWLVGAFILFLISLITHPFMNAQRHCKLGNKILGNAFVGFFAGLKLLQIVKIDDSELDDYVAIDGPLIIASNHPSLWDAPMLMHRFITVSCIMKVEILNNIILRSGSRFAGFVPNTPTLTMVRKATEHLDRGGRLLMFPEGTRTRPQHAPLNPFRHGLALLTKTAKCPILPVFIFMNSGYMRKGWPIWKMPPVPISVKIKVGEVLEMKDDEDTHAFSDRLEAYFRNFVQTEDPWNTRKSEENTSS